MEPDGQPRAHAPAGVATVVLERISRPSTRPLATKSAIGLCGQIEAFGVDMADDRQALAVSASGKSLPSHGNVLRSHALRNIATTEFRRNSPRGRRRSPQRPRANPRWTRCRPWHRARPRAASRRGRNDGSRGVFARAARARFSIALLCDRPALLVRSRSPVTLRVTRRTTVVKPGYHARRMRWSLRHPSVLIALGLLAVALVVLGLRARGPSVRSTLATRTDLEQPERVNDFETADFIV